MKNNKENDNIQTIIHKHIHIYEEYTAKNGEYTIKNFNKSPKSNLVALLLCIFLGSFGIHRFYVGKVGSAIVQLILTITVALWFISAIWVLIDLIRICCSEFKDSNDKKLMWDK